MQCMHLVLLKKNHLPEKNLEKSFEKACLYLKKIYKRNDSSLLLLPNTNLSIFYNSFVCITGYNGRLFGLC